MRYRKKKLYFIISLSKLHVFTKRVNSNTTQKLALKMISGTGFRRKTSKSVNKLRQIQTVGQVMIPL